MIEIVPLVIIKDKFDDKYAYRLGQHMSLYGSCDTDSDPYTQVHLSGPGKSVLIVFDLPLSAVVGLIEKAEREALERMTENDG